MYDYLAKVILLGPSGSGKFVHTLEDKVGAYVLRSCLLHRIVKNECAPQYP